MPQPTSRQVHEDILLTNISIAYKVDLAMYIADKVFPNLPVQKQSNKYRIYDKNEWFLDDVQKLASGSQSAETGYGLSTDTYFADVFALGHVIDEQERANYDEPGDPDTDTTEFLTQKMMIRRERQWVDDYFKLGVWDTDKVGAVDLARWSDQAGSDPKRQIQQGKNTVLTQTGFIPNGLVVGYDAHQALTRHPLIRDQFKYTSAESITQAMIAKYFELDDYHVSMAAVATNEENAATEVMQLIAGNNALLYYAPATPSLKKPSAGYTFTWSGLTGMNNLGIRTLNIPDPLRHGNKIEQQMAFDMKVVATDLGYFFSDMAVDI